MLDCQYSCDIPEQRQQRSLNETVSSLGNLSRTISYGNTFASSGCVMFKKAAKTSDKLLLLDGHVMQLWVPSRYNQPSPHP